MATKKFSQLSTGTTANASDKLPIERSGANFYVTPAMIKTYINPMTTLGDLIKGGASGVLSRLGIGSTGQVLTVVAGEAAWATPAAGGSVGLVARYRLGANLTLGTGFTIADFDTMDYDPGSDVTTGAAWVYTVPATAWYQVVIADALFIANASAWANDTYAEATLFKNGSTAGTIRADRTNVNDSTSRFLELGGSIAVSCVTNDTLQVKIWNGTAVTRKLEAPAAIEIYRVT